MSSLREQVLARVVQVLQNASTGSSVFRDREVSITRATSPATVVIPKGNEVSKMATDVHRNLFEFALEHFVRGDPWSQLADPVDVASHAALMGDATLAGLVADLQRVSEEFEAQEADRTAGTLTVRYRGTFLTSRRAIDKAG